MEQKKIFCHEFKIAGRNKIIPIFANSLNHALSLLNLFLEYAYTIEDLKIYTPLIGVTKGITFRQNGRVVFIAGITEDIEDKADVVWVGYKGSPDGWVDIVSFNNSMSVYM